MEEDRVKIAVLSGKGGTGKTLVSVNLAAAAKKSTYIDCDVEEPNGHLFFKPVDVKSKEISIRVPVVDEVICSGCRRCVDFCKFNALAYTHNKLMIFDEICHSCGGCILICPHKALLEKERVIGVIERGISEGVTVATGILNTGEASGVPLIKELLTCVKEENEISFIDCPPGTACIVMESIKDADYCILVTEPTLFGVHNLNMVYELIKLFNKPHGVVLNKVIEQDNPAEKFCIQNNIKVIGRIPFDKELGDINSKALISVKKSDKYNQIFTKLLEKVLEEVDNEAVTSS